MLKECLPVISLLIAGYCRDRFGRNLPIFIFSACGQLLGTIVLVISAFYPKGISVYVTVVVESVITGLGGSFPLLLMTAACYISQRSTAEDRTSRMSWIMASYLIGMTIGFFLSGMILQRFGFMGLFTTSLVLAAIVLLYFCIFIREVPMPAKKSMPIWIVIKTVFRKRENHLRPIVFLMIVVHCLFGTALRCEANVFMFFLRKSIGLDPTKTGIYSSYRSIILSISTFIVIPVLSKYFKIKDVILGIMCASLNCASAIWTAFARNTTELFLCPLGDLLRGGVYAVEKSIVTKCVGTNETGQVISAEYVIEAVCHIVVLPLYTYVFNVTATSFPGAFFFISAVFSFITIIIFCITQFVTKDKEVFMSDKDPERYSSSSEE
ncbi:hypothetical protein O3M35_001200 [Rhynocoris fuscipes]|uniref:Proton-coupled folate transporter n=1 Tax=Rhynocoris fuscipes TaxID=488301 RepID=A0AAW1DRA8_9HEMI